jgi:hypothetical protein
VYGLGGSGHILARPPANSIMQPRIYTYKITFEEVPYWYWGVHKEKKFGELYLGSPKTHRWVWEFYTPKVQILEFFPFTEAGWKEAQEVEKRLIRNDLNNPLCLNESCGGMLSHEVCSKGGKKAAEKLHAERDEDGKSLHGKRLGTIHGPKGTKKTHSAKDEKGRSLHAVRTGKMAAEKIHKEKDELGRSIHAVETATKIHSRRDEEGRSLHALNAFKDVHLQKDERGKSITGVKGARAAHSEKDELGRSLLALRSFKDVHKEKTPEGKSALSVRAGKAAHTEKDANGKSVHGIRAGKIGGKQAAKIVNAQKWEDPDHPELGQHSPGTLVRMQKRRGLPSGKENRRKVC